MMRSKRSSRLVFNELAVLVAGRGDDDSLRRFAEKKGRLDHYEKIVTTIDGGSPRAKAAAAMLQAFQWDGQAAAAAVMKLDQLSWVPERTIKKPAGAPVKWGQGKKLYAWLAVESVWRADKKKEPQIGVSTSIALEFRRRRGRSWVLVQTDRETLQITQETARLYHRAGAKILREGGDALRARWERLAARAAEHVLAARGK